MGEVMKDGAIVLAGGFGTRLRPLTEEIPKPLAPVLGKSVYMHILDLLARNGITSASVAVAYKSHLLTELKHERVKTRYFVEEKPLGTAGCVKNAEYALDDTFIVISGDAICDFDLSKALEYHKQKGARATILLARASTPLEYGGVLTEDGYVTRFVEKPAWRQTVTDTVSAGIYILEKSVLEKVKAGEFSDFAKDLFPAMFADGEKIAALVCDGYWCDIGDLRAYYRCNFDALEGKIKLEGRQSTIAEDFEGNGATVERSIIHRGVVAGGESVIKGSIICEGCRIGRGCVIGEGCVVGAYTVINDGAVLAPNTVVASHKKVRAGLDMFYGGESRTISEGRLCGKPDALDCGFFVRLGGAFAKALIKKLGEDKVKPFGISHGTGTQALLLARAFACGVLETGLDCTDCGEVGFSQAANAVKDANLSSAAHITATDGTVCVSLLDLDALPPERAVERKIVAEFIEDKYLKDVSPGAILSFDANEAYNTKLLQICGDLSGIDVSVTADTESFFADILRRAGAKVYFNDGKDSIRISSDGRDIKFCGLDFWHSAAAAIVAEILENKTGTYALPYVSPDGLHKFVESAGAKVFGYSPSPADGSDTEARSLAGEQLWLRDSYLLAGKLLASAKKLGVEPGKLAETLFTGKHGLPQLPPFYTSERELEHDPDSIAGTMRSLCEASAKPAPDGARIDFDNGSVVIVPSASGFRLFAQSVSAEAAEELCAQAEREIKARKNS